MILVDTGPLVALFEPQDAQHAHCRAVLRTLREPLFTTVAVLTGAFHMLFYQAKPPAPDSELPQIR